MIYCLRLTEFFWRFDLHRLVDINELKDACYSINVNGFCKIDNFILKDKVDLLLDKVKENHEQFYKGKSLKGVPDRDITDKIIYNVQNVDYAFVNLVSSDPINSIGKHFLNDEHYRYIDNDKPNYNLTYLNARSSGSKLDLHIDSGIPFKGEYVSMMQFIFLLEDSTEKNGCTVVLPGSHQSGEYTDRSLDFKDLKKLEGKKGDLFVWDSRLWHGTMDNVDQISRWEL